MQKQLVGYSYRLSFAKVSEGGRFREAEGRGKEGHRKGEDCGLHGEGRGRGKDEGRREGMEKRIKRREGKGERGLGGRREWEKRIKRG